MKKPEEIYNQKIDYRAIIKNFLLYRYLFIGTVFLFLFIAVLYNRFSLPVYENSTSILVKRKDINTFLSSKDIMSGYGMMYNKEKIEDELDIIGSFSLTNKAVKKLNLEVHYYEKSPVFSRIKSSGDQLEIRNDLYLNVPIIVQINKSKIQAYDVPFCVKILNDSNFHISTEAKNFYLFDYMNDESQGPISYIKLDSNYRFGELIEGKYYSFKIFLNPIYSRDNYASEIFFNFSNTEYLTTQFQSALKINKTLENSSIYNISMKGKNPAKITDFLNTLTSVYLEKNLDNKNKILDNTILFIDNQVEDISDSLSFTEDALQSYQTRNRITNLSFQGEKTFEKVKDLESERSKLLVQQRYYDYIIEYFQSNEDVSDLVAPSSMNVEDKLLNELIIDLIQKSIKRSYYMSSQSTKNLYLREIEANIRNLKKTILENILYNKEQTIISLQELEKRISRYHGDIASLPATERGLIGIQRKYKLNDAIFTFLLQKRAEAQIAKASNTPDFEIIDPARMISIYLVFPKKKLNLLIALILGLLLPFSYILIKDFLNNRVYGIIDLKRLTKYPILGMIPRNNKKFTNVIANYPDAQISENFRSVRTSIQNHLPERPGQCILITSSSRFEGKTFNAVNIASVFALEGKKTLLIDFDLRTSGIHSEFAISNNTGVSSYLEKNVPFNDIIHQTSIKNLTIIPTGPKVTNPAELITSEKTVELLAKAKDLYDFVFIDTTSLDYVTDTFLLMKLTDMNIIIVRDQFTSKDVLMNSIEKIIDNNAEQLFLLFNSENTERIFRYIGFGTLGRYNGKRRGLHKYLPYFSGTFILFAGLMVMINTGFLANPYQSYSVKSTPIPGTQRADNLISPSNIKIFQPSTMSISNDFVKETEQISSPPEVNLSADTIMTDLPGKIVYNETNYNAKHYIIAGSYNDLPSAQNHLNQLFALGFNALVISTDGNTYRVCYGVFKDKKDAQQFKQDSLVTRNLKGWYLVSSLAIRIPVKPYAANQQNTVDETAYLKSR